MEAPGLPRELVRVPLEYFARAVRVLRRQPGVDPACVVVMGDARGGEAALLLASTFPRLIHGGIGLVPSSSVFRSPAANLPAWTLRGNPVSDPRAGHCIGGALPYLPTSTEASPGDGTPRADAAARADLWPPILRYFARL